MGTTFNKSHTHQFLVKMWVHCFILLQFILQVKPGAVVLPDQTYDAVKSEVDNCPSWRDCSLLVKCFNLLPTDPIKRQQLGKTYSGPQKRSSSNSQQGPKGRYPPAKGSA